MSFISSIQNSTRPSQLSTCPAQNALALASRRALVSLIVRPLIRYWIGLKFPRFCPDPVTTMAQHIYSISHEICPSWLTWWYCVCWCLFIPLALYNLLGISASLTQQSLVLVTYSSPDSKVHGAHMGPTWVLSAPDGPHVGPMDLAIRETMDTETEILSLFLVITLCMCHTWTWSSCTSKCHDDVIKGKHFPRYREFTGPRCIPRTKASDAELWCFLWSVLVETVQ